MTFLKPSSKSTPITDIESYLKSCGGPLSTIVAMFKRNILYIIIADQVIAARKR